MSLFLKCPFGEETIKYVCKYVCFEIYVNQVILYLFKMIDVLQDVSLNGLSILGGKRHPRQISRS